jgi:hypothetical protein
VLEDRTNPPASTTSGSIYESITDATSSNNIWGVSPPANTVAINWTCPDDGTTYCVGVDVYRDGTHNSSTLPTFFLTLAGVTSQGTKAHAVAKVVEANEADCVRPWFMVDHYTDTNGDGQYDAGDVYDSSTSYKLPDDLGVAVTFHTNLSPSGYGQLDVGSGGSAIQDAIMHCASNYSVSIGQSLAAKPGGTTGPEISGIQSLINWDSAAHWDTTTHTVQGSCAPAQCTCDGSCPYGGRLSPRVVLVPVCSPLQAACAQGGPSNSSITVTNILAFFITGPATGSGNNMDIPAILIGTSGELSSNPSAGHNDGSFVYNVKLIR